MHICLLCNFYLKKLMHSVARTKLSSPMRLRNTNSGRLKWYQICSNGVLVKFQVENLGQSLTRCTMYNLTQVSASRWQTWLLTFFNDLSEAMKSIQTLQPHLLDYATRSRIAQRHGGSRGLNRED